MNFGRRKTSGKGRAGARSGGGRADAKAGARRRAGSVGAKTAPRRRSWLRQAFRWLLRALLLAGAAAVAWVALYAVVNPPGGIYMASEAWRLGSIEREWRDLDEISPRLARAVIAAEDARFCDHPGFDVEAIREAIRLNEQGRRTYGASTISQQVAKNVFLWHQRSWLRKGLEAGFTVLIELIWGKRRILEVYVNTAEFAEGVFGAEAAAYHHFGRPAEALTPVQAARLAAVLPNPKARSASRPSAFVKRRTRRVAAGAETIRRDGRDRCVQ